MNKSEDQSQNDANDLGNVPNPPVEELSEDELNNVAGGAQVDYLKLDSVGLVSKKAVIPLNNTIKTDNTIKP